MRSKLILNDSGGIQKEAPALGIPVLVMRDHTERTEGIETGDVRLIGTKKEGIISNVSELLSDSKAYDAMAVTTELYGGGHAFARIIGNIADFLNGKTIKNRT